MTQPLVPSRAATDVPALAVSGLRVTFSTETGDVEAVRDVAISVQPGETVALVGESGSGKSTVALAALRLLPGNARLSGQVLVDGQDIAAAGGRALRELRGESVSMVFQEPATALDPLMRVGHQIAEVLRNHGDLGRSEAWTRAVDLLGRVGIPDPAQRARAFPHQLSGGQRQRVVIAMAVANDPKMLIADEPTTALDVTVQADILDMLRGLARERRMGLLLVTHNMGVVADTADRVAVMYQGEIVEEGEVEQVLLHPRHEYSQRLLAAVPRLQVAEGQERSTTGAATSTVPAVLAEDLTVTYGRGATAVHAVDGVSLRIEPGRTVGLVGESGSGKSTVTKVVLGLLPPTQGTIQVLGSDPFRIHGRARRALRRGVGVVMQDPSASLDPRMTVGDCIAEPILVHERRRSRRERDAKVGAILDAVHLSRGLVQRSPRELSGGQRQRVSLARALVLGPQLLVADEPTSALDVSVQRSVLDLIQELQTELGFACLFVSHDLAVVQEVSDTVYVMREGRVVEHGPTAGTLSHPETGYTRRLLAAVPVPDPQLQRERRTAWRELKTKDDTVA